MNTSTYNLTFTFEHVYIFMCGYMYIQFDPNLTVRPYSNMNMCTFNSTFIYKYVYIFMYEYVYLQFDTNLTVRPY